MRLGILRLAVACVLASTITHGQLHVIAGAPTPDDGRHYALALFRVGNDGSVRSLANLVPSRLGTGWIGIAQDKRKALIYSRASSSDAVALVLDLNTATVVKRCSLPFEEHELIGPGPLLHIKVPVASLITQFLADVPGRGLTFDWFESGPPPVGERLQGMLLDPAIPCEKSLTVVAPTENRYIAAYGSAGVGDLVSGSGVAAFLDADGDVMGAVYGDDQTPWGYKVPSGFVAGRKSPTPIVVAVNDPQMLVLFTEREPHFPATFLAFRKRDKTWHLVPAHVGNLACIRSFGKYLAMTETRHKKSTAARTGDIVTLEDNKRKIADEALSPGVDEWRTAVGKKWEGLPGCSKFGCESEFGPDMFDSFDDSEDYFPGRLHLFDIETERTFTIETKQGDSEILLVDANIVYYRVSDRLYSAPIGDSGVGTPKLVATNEVIRDVHYAFMTHSE